MQDVYKSALTPEKSQRVNHHRAKSREAVVTFDNPTDKMDEPEQALLKPVPEVICQNNVRADSKAMR